MKAFARLYAELDATTSTSAKLEALARYFASAPATDAAWATYFLAGGRPRQLVPSRLLRECAMERAGLDAWLFEECHQAVGDFAETVAHVLPPAPRDTDRGLAQWVQRLYALRGASAEAVRKQLFEAWDELDWNGRFLMLKLIGGGFRVGVSRVLVTRALAAHAGIDPKIVAQRLIGYTGPDHAPDAAAFEALVARGEVKAQSGQPYPFFLAQPLLADPHTLGPVEAWQVEWKWDGVRAQLVARGRNAWLWSRGEELVTDRFPELAALAAILPEGTVIDGEIIAWKDGAPLPFAVLQTRLGRKSVDARLLDRAPVVLLAYDLLEHAGQDVRQRTQSERRRMLEALAADARDKRLVLSPTLEHASWDDYARLKASAREHAVEGLMLKHRDAPYGVGRTRSGSGGGWWKWKIDPMSVDAVLVYAQRGHGRRASLYSDYTFAVWDEDREGEGRRLVPFAKAYSGLTDEEIARVDAVIRRTTVEKFGPVRSVTPTLVFELGFEAIQRSTRHKSGIAVRFPRILRWRTDKRVEDADTMASLHSLLAGR